MTKKDRRGQRRGTVKFSVSELAGGTAKTGQEDCAQGTAYAGDQGQGEGSEGGCSKGRVVGGEVDAKGDDKEREQESGKGGGQKYGVKGNNHIVEKEYIGQDGKEEGSIGVDVYLSQRAGWLKATAVWGRR